MEKPKTLEQLRAEKERAETRLAQEQHKLNRLENRKKFLEQGERKKRTHRLCNLGGTVESLSLIHIFRYESPTCCITFRCFRIFASSNRSIACDAVIPSSSTIFLPLYMQARACLLYTSRCV